MTRRILVDSSPVYLHGTNYPWMVKNGKSNYGLDFGVNLWGTHEGVSTNLKQVEDDFAEMERLGFNTLRWFVFTDGRGGIRFDIDGMPISVADKFFEDIEAALLIAQRHRVRIIFVLMDFLWLRKTIPSDSTRSINHFDVVKTNVGRRLLVENIFVPVFERFAGHPSILAWEVMNEPDWVVSDLAPKQNNNSGYEMPLDEFKDFVRTVADAVHVYARGRVTVGGGLIKNMNVWDDDALDLDFLQVHTYNDFLNQSTDHTLFDRSFEALGLRRPLLIGEFTTNGRKAFDVGRNYYDISLWDYLTYSHAGGFAGALFWSFNGVDGCGTEDRATLLKWREACSFLANSSHHSSNSV
jgi:endo-1,4-beta-mannosidase